MDRKLIASLADPTGVFEDAVQGARQRRHSKPGTLSVLQATARTGEQLAIGEHLWHRVVREVRAVDQKTAFACG